jgi:perosamine synthetase
VSGLITPAVAPRRSHVWHQYTLRVTSAFPLARDALVGKLREAGIGSAIYYPIPVHQQEALRALFADGAQFPCAEELARQVISIPVHPGLSDADREDIATTLEGLGNKG